MEHTLGKVCEIINHIFWVTSLVYDVVGISKCKQLGQNPHQSFSSETNIFQINYTYSIEHNMGLF